MSADVDDRFKAYVIESGRRKRVEYTTSDAIKGAKEPLVTIVEFSDFQCPYCSAFANTLEELLIAYPKDVRLVFMQFPMPMHRMAKDAAKAAVAAQEQDLFWVMHDHLFANRNGLAPEAVIEQAKALGLDAGKFKADLESEATAKRVAREHELGQALGVRGTPAFFLNGLPFSGAVDPEKLAKFIELEREHALGLVKAGVPRREVYAHIMRASQPVGTLAAGGT